MSENEKLVERLQAPVRIGGTTSEDSYEVYDELRLEAATALTAAQARIRELEAELTASRKLAERRAAERDKEAERADGNYFEYQEMIRERDALTEAQP